MLIKNKHERGNLQKFEYLDDKMCILGEIKSIFHSFLSAFLW